MALADDLDRIAGLATAQAGPADAVSAVIATEPRDGERAYLCAFDGGDGLRSWLAVRADGSPVTSRAALREAGRSPRSARSRPTRRVGATSNAHRAARGGARDGGPRGDRGGEAAARALRVVLGEPPQVATPARLDEIGAATRRLERELDLIAPSRSRRHCRAQAAVSELQREVEAGYRAELTS